MADNDKAKKPAAGKGGAVQAKQAKVKKVAAGAAPGADRDFTRPKDYKPRLKTVYETNVR